jgi:VIT1/CCC1 family predicted Fe2+/Mn2+ transporter
MIAMHLSAGESFAASVVMTGITFFAIGVIRGRVVDQRPLASGFETLAIGGSAAILAFLVGWLLRGLALPS